MRSRVPRVDVASIQMTPTAAAGHTRETSLPASRVARPATTDSA